MYVSQIPNRNSKPTWLIRTSTRVGNKVVKTTISNITRLPQPIIDGIGILWCRKEGSLSGVGMY